MFYLLCKIEVLGKGHLKTGWLDQLHNLTPVSLSASEHRDLMVTVSFALKSMSVLPHTYLKSLRDNQQKLLIKFKQRISFVNASFSSENVSL